MPFLFLFIVIYAIVLVNFRERFGFYKIHFVTLIIGIIGVIFSGAKMDSGGDGILLTALFSVILIFWSVLMLFFTKIFSLFMGSD